MTELFILTEVLENLEGSILVPKYDYCHGTGLNAHRPFGAVQYFEGTLSLHFRTHSPLVVGSKT